MNTKSLLTTTGSLLLSLTIACGGGSSSPSGPTATSVATPVVTAPAYAAATGPNVFPAIPATFTVSTQVQPGCTYAWTISDAIAKITSGQGTASIVVSGPFTANLETLTATVKVSATTSSLDGQALVQIVAPPRVSFSTLPDPINNPFETNTPYPVGIDTSATNPIFNWVASGAPDGGVNENIVSISNGQGTNAVVLAANAVGTVVVSCTVTDPLTSLSTTATESIQVFNSAVPKPTAQSIVGPTTIQFSESGLVYSVPSQVGCNYAWTVDNGTINSGVTTNSITYTAHAASSNPNASPYVHFYLTISNAGGSITVDCTAKMVSGS